VARRAALVVLDGLGIGEAPDAARWGDAGSDTLGNVLRSAGHVSLPNLSRLGLGCIAPLPGVPAAPDPQAAWGRAVPGSEGKDSTTGHWELCGVVLDTAFPTYPAGFPAPLLDAFSRHTGRGIVCNRPASGTAVLEEFGSHHVATGDWIVYTSADSVFQVAAHEETVPLAELYAACQVARDLLAGPHAVSRVIARPFVGTPGHWVRTANRRDLSVPPPLPTLLDHLEQAGIPRVGVGKVDDLFAGRGIVSRHTRTNAEAYQLIGEALDLMDRGFLLANVIEFDQTWGHRNDIPGFVRGLRELDAVLPVLLQSVRPDDLIILTADHGNDPTTPSTDHSREVVPVLVAGPRVRPVPLGTRQTLADVGQTIAEFLAAAPLSAGTSFLPEIWHE
jgi:phosphopentomutase